MKLAAIAYAVQSAIMSAPSRRHIRTAALDPSGRVWTRGTSMTVGHRFAGSAAHTMCA